MEDIESEDVSSEPPEDVSSEPQEDVSDHIVVVDPFVVNS
jgi:hypothetical protein